MPFQGVVASDTGAQQAIQVDVLPSICPLCTQHQVPRAIGAYEAVPGLVHIFMAYKCVNRACSQLFIAEYVQAQNGVYRLTSLQPKTPVPPTIPESVKSVSPAFVEIITQVSAAEAANLSQLVGVGMRKALEFLIKDFAVSRDNQKRDDIQKRPLAQVIKDYIDDSQVKKLAERAVWLGNDETHYIKKWEQKDINDLKALVRLTVNAIDNKIEGDKHIDSMPPPQLRP